LTTATGQEVEYNISTTNDGNGLKSTWQAGVTFTGLEGGTGYYVYARSKQNSEWTAGTNSVSAKITTSQPLVTFETNDGKIATVVTVTKGNKVTKPANPTYQGNNFDYWYTDEALTAPYDFDLAVTKSITLSLTRYSQYISVI